MSPIKIASMQVEVVMQTFIIFIIRVRMITIYLIQQSTYLTMNRMHAIPSMWLKAKDRSKTCLKTYILKVKSTCSSTTTPIITEVADKEIITLQEQATHNLDKSSELYGVVLVGIVNRIIKCKEVALRSLELFLDKLMLTLRSKCTVIGTSEITCRCRRKKT